MFPHPHEALHEIELQLPGFPKEKLIIKMMTVGGRRAVGRAGVNNSFPEPNSATITKYINDTW